MLEAVGRAWLRHLVDHISARGSRHAAYRANPLVIEVFTRLADGSIGAAVDWERVSVWSANSAHERSLDATARCALGSLGVPPEHLHLVSHGGRHQRPGARSSERYAAELRRARAWTTTAPFLPSTSHSWPLVKRGPWLAFIPNDPRPTTPDAVTVDRVTGEVTLTLTALSTAREVWLLGVGKTGGASVHLALTGGPLQVPAAGARGQARTLCVARRTSSKRTPLVATPPRLPLATRHASDFWGFVIPPGSLDSQTRHPHQ